MKTAFRRSFERDLKKLPKDRQMLERVQVVIEEVEAVAELGEISNMKKLSGGSGDYYRIRIGDYRIGLEVESNKVAVFVRCLHRREIYRYFP